MSVGCEPSSLSSCCKCEEISCGPTSANEFLPSREGRSWTLHSSAVVADAWRGVCDGAAYVLTSLARKRGP